MKNRKSKKRSYFSYLWKCLAVSAVFVGYTATDTVRIINQTYIADYPQCFAANACSSRLREDFEKLGAFCTFGKLKSAWGIHNMTQLFSYWLPSCSDMEYISCYEDLEEGKAFSDEDRLCFQQWLCAAAEKAIANGYRDPAFGLLITEKVYDDEVKHYHTEPLCYLTSEQRSFALIEPEDTYESCSVLECETELPEEWASYEIAPAFCDGILPCYGLVDYYGPTPGNDRYAVCSNDIYSDGVKCRFGKYALYRIYDEDGDCAEDRCELIAEADDTPNDTSAYEHITKEATLYCGGTDPNAASLQMLKDADFQNGTSSSSEMYFWEESAREKNQNGKQQTYDKLWTKMPPDQAKPDYDYYDDNDYGEKLMPTDSNIHFDDEKWRYYRESYPEEKYQLTLVSYSDSTTDYLWKETKLPWKLGMTSLLIGSSVFFLAASLVISLILYLIHAKQYKNQNEAAPVYES